MTYTAKTAAEELRTYNEWRRGNDSYGDETGPDPVELGRLIDFCIAELENAEATDKQRNRLLGVMKMVASEVTDGVRPTSSDSYLPADVVRDVHAAIANATGATP